MHKNDTQSGTGTNLSGDEIVPNTIEQSELFKLEYTEKKTETETTVDPQVEIRSIINPIPQQCPTHILSRPLKVQSFPLSTFVNSAYINTWLQNYQDVMNTFTYWKADFRLKFVMRSSATTYGWALIGYVYGAMPTFTDPEEQLRFYSTAESSFLDVTAADAVTLEVPFMFPASYFEQGKTDLLKYITVFCWCPQENLANISTSTPNVTLDIFIEAYNIDVGGYRQPTSPAPANIELHGDVVQANPGSRGLLPLVMRNAGTLGTLASVGALGWKGFNNLATIDKNIELVKKYTVGREKPQSQTKTKEKDKQDPTSIMISPYGNMNSMDAQQSTPLLTGEGIGGMFCNPSVTKLSDLCMIPEIDAKNARTFTDTSGGSNSVNIILDDFGPFGRILADTFRFNRGTHRVGLTFFTHPMIAARFQVQIFYAETSGDLVNTAVPTEYFLVKGTQTKMFDIPFHLDTVVALGSRGVSTERIIAVLQVTCTQLPQPFATGITPKVFMIPTISGTEDCQFFSLRSRQGFNSDAPPPANIELHSLRMMHREPGELFGTKGLEIPYLPEITTLEQLCQRWSLRDVKKAAQTPAQNSVRLDPTPYGLQLSQGFGIVGESIPYGCEYDIWSQAFVETRSSMDFKVVLHEAPPATETRFGKLAWAAMQDESDTSTGIDSAMDPRNGVAFAFPSMQPSLEYSVPFLSRYRINSVVAPALDGLNTVVQLGINTNVQSFAPTVGETQDPTAQIVWARAGKDLQFIKVNFVPLYYQKAQTQ